MGRNKRDFVPKFKVFNGVRYTLLEVYYDKTIARGIAEQWRKRQGHSVRVARVPGTHEFRLYGVPSFVRVRYDSQT